MLTTSTGILQCPWRISELQKWCFSILLTLGKGSLKSRKALGCSLAPAAAGIVFKFFCSFSKYELKPRKMLEDFIVILHSIIKEQVKFPSKSGVRKILSLSLSYLQLICHLNLTSGLDESVLLCQKKDDTCVSHQISTGIPKCLNDTLFPSSLGESHWIHVLCRKQRDVHCAQQFVDVFTNCSYICRPVVQGLIELLPC